MQDFSGIKQKFSDLKCCVIIPTYNNDRTLEKVIEDSSQYDDDTKGITMFNDMVQNDPEVENVLIPIRDGLMLIRKKE